VSFPFKEAFWRRHPGVCIATFGILVALAVLASQLNSRGSAVLYQSF
jgi:hypothetical protein